MGTEEVIRTRDPAGDHVDANAKWRYIGSAVQLWRAAGFAVPCGDHR